VDNVVDRPKVAYQPPATFGEVWLDQAIALRQRQAPVVQSSELFEAPVAEDKKVRSLLLYFAGDLTLLKHPFVAIVGTREISDDGTRRTRKLAAMLAKEQIVVLSGLAMDVDAAALSAALDARQDHRRNWHSAEPMQPPQEREAASFGHCTKW
jgi:DNA processing protein